MELYISEFKRVLPFLAHHVQINVTSSCLVGSLVISMNISSTQHTMTARREESGAQHSAVLSPDVCTESSFRVLQPSRIRFCIYH